MQIVAKNPSAHEKQVGVALSGNKRETTFFTYFGFANHLVTHLLPFAK
jgi:hypothetical protein